MTATTENTKAEAPTVQGFVSKAITELQCLENNLYQAQNLINRNAQEQLKREQIAYELGESKAMANRRPYETTEQHERVKLCLKFCEGVSDEELRQMSKDAGDSTPLRNFIFKAADNNQELRVKNSQLTLALITLGMKASY